jgi:hypothetical protein
MFQTEYQAGELGDVEIKGLFDYEGYHPLTTFAFMKEIEKNDDHLTTDIKIICYFSANRGTRTNKAMTRMSDEGKEILKQLIKKYNIIDTTPKKKEDITIARITGIMPSYMASLIEANKTKVIGKEVPGLPKSLCFPGAPALIPLDNEDLFLKWLEWANSFNKIIRAGADSERVLMYGHIVWQSNYVPEHVREKSIEKRLSLNSPKVTGSSSNKSKIVGSSRT